MNVGTEPARRERRKRQRRRRQQRRTCQRKVRYEAYDVALRSAEAQRASRPVLYVYECCVCGGYHLTKRVPRAA